jgi:hypothetical protein
MDTGRHGEYEWLVSSVHGLDGLLEACPRSVVGRFVAVTSLDSGPLVLTPDEEAAGWRRVGEVAYSPQIGRPTSLPRPDGYDEWYVFAEPPAILYEPEVFVSFGGFTLRDPVRQLSNLDPTWDRRAAQAGVESEQDLQERFWATIERVRPSLYLAEGDNLICVSRDPRDFEEIVRWAQRTSG